MSSAGEGEQRESRKVLAEFMGALLRVIAKLGEYGNQVGFSDGVGIAESRVPIEQGWLGRFRRRAKPAGECAEVQEVDLQIPVPVSIARNASLGTGVGIDFPNTSPVAADPDQTAIGGDEHHVGRGVGPAGADPPPGGALIGASKDSDIGQNVNRLVAAVSRIKHHLVDGYLGQIEPAPVSMEWSPGLSAVGGEEEGS